MSISPPVFSTRSRKPDRLRTSSALFHRPHASLEKLFARDTSIVIALDGVQDPGNVGTIVRLAAAFDANGIVLLPGCADPFSPKAIRSSAGAILTVPVVSATVDELLARGWPIVAADARGEISDPPARHAVLAFGSEGPDSPPPWRRPRARSASGCRRGSSR